MDTSRVVGLAAAVVLAAAACGGSESAPANAAGGDSAAAACPTQGEGFETAKLYVEHNATDEDTGIHGSFGAEGWSILCIWDPTGREVLVVDPLQRLDGLTMADIFFESREPESDEYSVDDLRADFPEGEYRVGAVDFEGRARTGVAVFTHDIPAEPEITSPRLVEEPEDAAEAAVPTTGLVVSWEPVTETIDGDPITPTGYEVIVTMEEFDDPHGFSRPVFDVHVPPDVGSLAVPDGFLLPATVYELEVLALEASGNQTISVGFFATA